MATLRIQAPLQFPGYEQTNAGGSNDQVLTYTDGKADWKSVAAIVESEFAFHYVDYDFATGMLIERYPQDPAGGEDFIIDPLIEYQLGLIENEFELRDDGFLVYIQNG